MVFRFTHATFSLAMAAALVAMLPPVSLRAQVLYGSITGNVTDKSGLPMASAKAEALNTGTGSAKQAGTDAHGAFAFNDLQPGVYKVTISAPGFATASQAGIQLDANTTRRVDVSLEIAQVSQSVTVDESVVTLQADRATVNTQISEKEVEELPAGGARNFQSLLEVVPGVTPPAAEHSEASNPAGALGTNVNGTSYSNNGMRIDGAVDSYPSLPEIVAYIPPVESIQAVSVSTGNYDAEQGMAGGSAVNVTIKSGTNAFHGSAWEHNTVSKLNARNFFYYGAGIPKSVWNQFGLTLGGPIKKNKLFFFADWERLMKRQAGNVTDSVPLALMRQGNFSVTTAKIYDPATGNLSGTGRTVFPGNIIPTSRLSPVAVTMAALLPLPNIGTAATSNYYAAGDYWANKDNVDFKINYNPNDRSTLFARYSELHYSLFDPPQLGAAGGQGITTIQPGNSTGAVYNSAVGGTYTVSPTLLADGNIGFTRQTSVTEDVDIGTNYGLDVLKIPGTNGSAALQGGYPFFAVTDYTAFGNSQISNPGVNNNNQYTFSGNLSWIKGSHSTRFGVDFVDYQLNQFAAGQKWGPRGGFGFTGGLTTLNGGSASGAYNDWADFMLGLPTAMGKDVQYLPQTVREKSLGLYARDQWQVRKDLTVTYGLRYEYYPLAHLDHYGFDRYDPTTNMELLGGLGGEPDNTGVSTGSGNFGPRLGIAYRIGEKTVIRTGYGITVDPNNYHYLDSAYPMILSQQLSGQTSFEAAGSLATGLPAIVLPDISGGKLAFPSNLGTTTYPQNMRRGYIQSDNFTIQREFGHGFNAQAGYVGTASIRQFAEVDINASIPNGGAAGRPLNVLYGDQSDIYVLEPFNSSRYNSLQTQAVKRFRGASAIRMSYTWSHAIDYSDNSDSTLTWNWASMLQRDRATAGYDRTHNLNVYGTYELPFGRGQRWLTQGFVNKIAGGWQINGIMSKVSGLPFTLSASSTALNSPGNAQTPNQILPEVQIYGTLKPYFNTAAFAQPVGAGVFGNAGRDILRGPGYFNLDSSVFRNFRITERFKLQFRAEAFGATNSPHFGQPNASITSGGAFGQITTSTGQRQLRFGLKLSY
jgi:hypothetical protein